MGFLSWLFGREDRAPAQLPRRDAKDALYVHLSFDGRIFLLPGDTGRTDWSDLSHLNAELERLPDGKGTILYSREAPDIDPPAEVVRTFNLIVECGTRKRLGIKLVDAHPLVAREAAVLIHIAAAGKADLAEARIRAGANVNQQDPTGLSPLMSAAYGGHLAVIDLLLANGASLELTDGEGLTALCFACNAGQLGAVTRLLAAGADVNHRDKGDNAPVMFAAQHGHTVVVEELIAKGADLQVRGNHGLTALGFARQNGRVAVARILQEHGAKE